MRSALEMERDVPLHCADLPSRADLVLKHLSFARTTVNHLATALPGHLDREDLMSAAVIGLITAADRFDPSVSVQFKTFAEQRIRGSVMDELRAQDQFGRGFRKKAKFLERELSLLEQRLGRKPSSEEMAQAMGLELADYYRLIEEVHQSIVSLDDPWQDSDGRPVQFADTLEDLATESVQSLLISRQTVEQVDRAIENLPAKERSVIKLHYYNQINLRKISTMLNLTESRISQLHSQAIGRLRSALHEGCEVD